MQIVGVIDILNGLAVHAKCGERSAYAPVKSVLSNDANPISIANAYRSYGIRNGYIADLNGILHGKILWQKLEQIAKINIDWIVDVGVTDFEVLIRIAMLGMTPILATESLREQSELAKQTQFCVENHIPFVCSLDLKGSMPLPSGFVAGRSSFELLQQMLDNNANHILLLDLLRVGSQSGVGTQPLVSWLRFHAPEVRVLVGGGIRSIDDIRELEALGVHAVLVATALHDGSLRKDDLIALETT